VVTDTDQDDSRGQGVVAEIGSVGGEAVFLHQDVSLEESWPGIVEAAERRFGRLDVMVANTRIGIRCKAVEMSLADWRRQTAVSLHGVFLSVKYAVQRCGALAVAPSSLHHPLPTSGDRQD
jgi:NAD(P)-dependent dehydrogenase (short-subunit alcohol dehydrogenase family)